MAKTTNILDLNNRLEKVEKEKVAQNSYTSLKNKPKINGHILTGDKSSSDLGLVGAETGKGLSSNDYTNADKAIVDGITTALQSYATKDYVNGFFANLGSFTVNDLNTFFKSSAIAFHQLNPIASRGYSVVTDWAYNGRFTGFFTDYNDSVDFVIAGGDNKRIFCGRYLLQADSLEVRTYTNTDKEQTVVSLNSAYDAGTDWNIVKQGNICVMNMRVLKDIPAGRTVIGTIPVDFRPEWDFYEYVYAANKDVHVGFNIEYNGQITAINNTGETLSGEVYVNRNVCYSHKKGE